jgi:ribosomal protein S18 acetylase RimI-like enzyme
MKIRISPLAPSRCADYLAFFDHEHGPAFADNRRWSTCYCHYHEVAPAIDWQTLDGPANRAAMRARIETGEMEGYLAYDGDAVVGWLNAQPRHKLPHAFARMGVTAPPIDFPDHDAAVIVCFVVAATHRRRGVARALLDFATADLGARGVALVDAFPFAADDRAGDAPHYHGPLALYDAAGFERVGTDGDRVAVRKRLARASE